jgi:predicted histidine transporter YuiF (NhaC family)
MTLNEGAVFKWVVIVGIAAALVIGVTLVTSQLVGALLGLAVVIAGCVYGFRWARRKRRAGPPSS